MGKTGSRCDAPTITIVAPVWLAAVLLLLLLLADRHKDTKRDLRSLRVFVVERVGVCRLVN